VVQQSLAVAVLAHKFIFSFCNSWVHLTTLSQGKRVLWRVDGAGRHGINIQQLKRRTGVSPLQVGISGIAATFALR
jgi:hypothetical protein